MGRAHTEHSHVTSVVAPVGGACANSLRRPGGAARSQATSGAGGRVVHEPGEFSLPVGAVTPDGQVIPEGLPVAGQRDLTWILGAMGRAVATVPPTTADRVMPPRLLGRGGPVSALRLRPSAVRSGCGDDDRDDESRWCGEDDPRPGVGWRAEGRLLYSRPIRPGAVRRMSRDRRPPRPVSPGRVGAVVIGYSPHSPPRLGQVGIGQALPGQASPCRGRPGKAGADASADSPLLRMVDQN